MIYWILAALFHFAPMQRHAAALPWGSEDEGATLARYVAIASTIDDVCEGDRSCAALLIAIGIGESGLSRDTDVGPCFRVGAYWTRCDSGRAASVWQVQGWYEDGRIVSPRSLFADRELAARQALKVARASLAKCRDLSGLSGRCQKGTGTWDDRAALWQSVKAWTP